MSRSGIMRTFYEMGDRGGSSLSRAWTAGSGVARAADLAEDSACDVPGEGWQQGRSIRSMMRRRSPSPIALRCSADRDDRSVHLIELLGGEGEADRFAAALHGVPPEWRPSTRRAVGCPTSWGLMISYVRGSLRTPSWWMPASWAKALRPTIALFDWTGSLVSCESSWLASVEPSPLDARLEGQAIGADAERHDELFERGVAGPLADAVDRALDLPRAALDGRDAVGDGEAEVVVAVRAEHRAVGVGHAAHHAGEEFARFVRRRVADRVRQVDGRGARRDDRLDDAAQEIRIRPRRILRRELHIVGELPRQADGVDRRLEAGFARHPELGGQVQVGGRQKRVDARPGGRLERARRLLDVPGHACGRGPR